MNSGGEKGKLRVHDEKQEKTPQRNGNLKRSRREENMR